MAVVIDIETRADSAKRDLDSLNRSLAKLVTSSNSSNKALGGISTNSFKDINKEINKNNDAFKVFGREGKNAFAGISTTAKKTSTSLNSLKKVVIGLSAAFFGMKTISFFNKTSDDLTNIQNKLKLVISSTDELLKRQGQLYKLSKETRSSFSGTVAVFTSFAKASEKLGLSQDKVLALTKTVQQATAMSGSDVEGIKAGLLQLSQGLSSGTLRGEELNSVLEQLPYLGNAIAKQLGMTTGQLRKFASEGSLDAKQVIKAISLMADTTEKDFKNSSITVAQSFEQVSTSFNMMIAELNQNIGFSTSFSKGLLALSSLIDQFNEKLKVASILVTQTIKNYISKFDIFSAQDLTIKSLLSFEISLNKVKQDFIMNKFIKSSIDNIRKVFNVKSTSEISKKPLNLSATTEIVASSSAGWAKSFNNMAENNKLLAAFADTVRVTANNLLYLVPVLAGPMATVFENMRANSLSTAVDLNALIYNALMPFGRHLEAISEKMSFWTRGDNALGRAWVDLFKSTDIVTFRQNLEKLNAERENLRLNDKKYVGTQIGRYFDEMNYGIQDVLISLDILDNKFIRIRQARFDRVIKYFSDMGDVANRVYKDVFATTVEPIVFNSIIEINRLLQIFGDTMHDTFSEEKGKAAATGLVNGISSAFSRLKTIGSELSLGKINIGTAITKVIFGETQSELRTGFEGLIGFIKAFFTQLTVEIKTAASKITLKPLETVFLNSISKIKSLLLQLKTTISDRLTVFQFNYDLKISHNPFEKALHSFLELFSKMQSKVNTILPGIESRISSFATLVKNLFFDIYEKVVGHSYWPDTIDGVNESTAGLSKAEIILSNFKDKVMVIFIALRDNIKNIFGKSLDILNVVFSKIGGMDIGKTIGIIGASAGATFMASFLLKMGSPFYQLAAIGYFVSLFNIAIDNMITEISPKLGRAMGAVSGEFSANAIKGVYAIFNGILAGVPTFVSAFIKNFVPFGDQIVSVFGEMDIFSNKLAHSIVLIGAAYGLLTKKGGKNISEFLFGKENKKKDTRTKGFVNHIMDAFKGPEAENVGSSFIARAFSNKKLALVAAGVLSTSLLDSVSMIEATQIGIPLMAYAIMGKDGGGRVLRDALSLVTLIGTSVVHKMFSFVGLGDIPFIQNLFMSQLDRGNSTQVAEDIADSIIGPPSANSAFRQAGVRLFDSFKQMVINLRENSVAFGANQMSLLQAALQTPPDASMGPLPQGTQSVAIDLRAQLAELGTAFQATEAGGGIVDAFSNLKDTFQEGWYWISSSFDNSGVDNVIIRSVKRIYKGITNLATAAIPYIKATFTFLLDFIRSKWLGYTILFLGVLGQTAYASTGAGEAISTLGDEIVFLTKVLAGAAVAAAAFGYTLAVIKAFKVGGLRAAFAYIQLSLIPLQEFGIALKEIVMTKFFSKTWWSGVGGSIVRTFKISEGALTAFKDSYKALSNVFGVGVIGGLKNMGAAILLFVKGNGLLIRDFFMLFVTGIGRAVTAFGILEAVTTLFGAILAGAVAGISEAFAALWVAISPMLLLAAQWIAAPLAVGALGLYLFGPGNSFSEKIAWAYDKVRGMIGLEATTKTGKLAQLKETTAPRKVGTETVDLASAVEKIDVEKLTAPQFKVLQDVAKSTVEGLNNLDELYYKQGRLTDSQIAEIKSLAKEFETVAGKQAQKPDTSYSDQMKVIANNMDDASLSTWDMIKNIVKFKWAALNFKTEFNIIPDVILNTISSFGPALKKTFSALLDVAIGGAISAAIGLIITTIAIAFGAAATPITLVASTIIGILGTALVLIADEIMPGVADKIMGSITGIFKEMPKAVDTYSQLFTGFLAWSKQKLREAQPNKQILEKLELKKAQGKQAAMALGNSKVGKYIQFAKSPELKAYASAAKDELEKALTDRNIYKKTFAQASSDNANIKDPGLYATQADAASKRFDKAVKAYLDMEAALGPVFQEDKRVAEFEEKVSAFAGSMKDVLKIDVGAKAESIFGKEADWAMFDKAIQDVVDIDFQLTFVDSLVDKVSFEEQKAKILARTKTYEESLKAAVEKTATIEGTLTFQADLIGGDQYKTAIDQLHKYDLAASKTFDEVSLSISNLEANLALLDMSKPADLQQYYFFLDAIKAGKENLTQMLPQNTWLDGLNSKLQTLNLEGFSADIYKSLDSQQLQEFNTKLNETIAATKVLDKLRENPNADRTLLLKEMQKVLDMTQSIKQNMQDATLNALRNISKLPATESQKSAEFQKVSGTQIPVEVSAKGNTEAFRSNYVELISLQDQLNKGIFAEGVTAASAGAGILRLQKEQSKLGESTILTMSSLLSNFSDLGIAFDTLNFSRLSVEARSALAGIGAEMESLNKLIAENPYSENVIALFKQQQDLLLSAADLLLEASYKTSAGVEAALGRIGISDSKSVSFIGANQLDAILGLDKAAEKARISLSRASGSEDYLARLKDFSNATIQASQAASKMANKFEDNISNINDVFKISLDAFDFTNMAPEIIIAASEIARSLKNELEYAIANNLPTADLFKRMKEASKVGELITLFKDMSKGLEDSISEGAVKGFERYKTAFSDTQATLKQFSALPKIRQQEIGKESTYQEAFKKAVQLDLTPEQKAILNTVNDTGSNIQEVMDKFRAKFVDAFKSDTQLLSDSNKTVVSEISFLIDELKANTAALRGEKVPEKKQLESSKDLKTQLSDLEQQTKAGLLSEKDFFKQAEALNPGSVSTKDINPIGKDIVNNVKDTSVKTEVATALELNDNVIQQFNKQLTHDLEILNTTFERGNYREVLKKSGMGADTLGSADPEQLKEAARLQVSVADLQEKIALAGEKDTRALQKQLDEAIYKRDALGQLIETNRTASLTAGISFAQNITGGFTDGLKALAKGKVTMKEAITTQLDLITSSVIDSFITGLTKPMSNMMTSVFEDIGKSLFEAGSSIGGGIDFGSIMSSVGTLFAATGGRIKGPGTGTSDSIPTMLSNGEFVINAKSAKEHLGILSAINTGNIPKFATGGLVGSISNPEMNARPKSIDTTKMVSNRSTGSQQIINVNVTGDISRQTKAEVYKMLPNIANGVNIHNKEKGYRG